MCSVTPITKASLIALAVLILGGSAILYGICIYMLVSFLW
jgi:hypothetical protein